MTISSFSFICLMVMLTGACASHQTAPPVWNFENDAIDIRLIADPRLHYDDGGAHTLMVCLYQLKNPNKFNQLSGEINGIYKLLECGAYESEVATTKRLIVRPGKNDYLTLDRAEGAKYLAVVAGYSNLKKEQMTRLYEIPIDVQKKGFIKRTKVLKPGKLIVDIELGPSQIR